MFIASEACVVWVQKLESLGVSDCVSDAFGNGSRKRRVWTDHFLGPCGCRRMVTASASINSCCKGSLVGKEGQPCDMPLI